MNSDLLVLDKQKPNINAQISPNDAANQSIKKIGIIAGGGNFPKEIIELCHKNKIDLFVIAFEGETDSAILENIEHEWVELGKIGKWIKILKKQKITDILLAGNIKRPSITNFKIDFQGAKLLTKIIGSKKQGDNSLFTKIISFLEDNGFNILNIMEHFPSLFVESGVLTDSKPDNRALDDIDIGKNVIKSLSQSDVGQSVIVQRGMVIGIEAVEGTDQLIKRCGDLQDEGSKAGILVKMRKIQQDNRIDLPTIGINTIENCYKNNIRGLALETGSVVIINKDVVINRANQLGMFITGV
ncbi:MAG: UDP-2,3-diacylglucosamine diphosphatase LpxI [Pseudomonadota bacterium]